MTSNRKHLLTILIFLICIWNLNIFFSYHFNDVNRIMENVGSYYVFLDKVQVRLWIDLPTVFPWRHCLELYGGHVETVSCGGDRTPYQTFSVEPLPGAGARLQLLGGEEECVTVDSGNNLGYERRNGSQPCSPHLESYWRWSNQTGSFKHYSRSMLDCWMLHHHRRIIHFCMKNI